MGQLSAPVIFGLNGLIYYCFYVEGINSIDGETKTKIGHGGKCMHYDPQTNLLYAGEGYEDHSGDSFLHVISP